MEVYIPEEDEDCIFANIGADVMLEIFIHVWPYEAELRATCRFFRSFINNRCKGGRIFNSAIKVDDRARRLNLICNNLHIYYKIWDYGDSYYREKAAKSGSIFLLKYVYRMIKLNDILPALIDITSAANTLTNRFKTGQVKVIISSDIYLDFNNLKLRCFEDYNEDKELEYFYINIDDVDRGRINTPTIMYLFRLNNIINYFSPQINIKYLDKELIAALC